MVRLISPFSEKRKEAMAEDLLKASLVLLKRGWLSMPLALDTGGFPKRPIVKEWSSLERTEETIRSLPWEQAKGIGIVLGEKSNGLAVIDIDDKELAGFIYNALRYDYPPRYVSTARQRGHLYVQEQQPYSPSTRFKIWWKEREITIELKSTGNQVACPPTPGYSLYDRGAQPMPCYSIAEAWEFVVDIIKAEYVEALHIHSMQSATGITNAGYPEPWQETVGEGMRNDSAYIEAHKLREAGFSMERALSHMRSRFDTNYVQGGITWGEIEQSIRSAYKKPVKTYIHEERGKDESQLFR